MNKKELINHITNWVDDICEDLDPVTVCIHVKKKDHEHIVKDYDFKIDTVLIEG